MVIYLDLLLGLNFYLDFLILMATSVVLKRGIKLKKIFLGALVGTLSMLILFFSLNQIELFLFKIGLGIFMNLVTFGYKNRRYLLSNFSYFFMIGVILGGFIYYLNLEFRYTSLGMILVDRGFNLNIVFILGLTPLILFMYIKQAKILKKEFNLHYGVKILLKSGLEYNLTGFLDTGNKLVDPITNKPIILLEKGIIDINEENIMYVPFNSLNNHNLIKCLKPKEVWINDKKYFNYLVGISDKKFNLNGVECILNSKLMEDMK